MPTVDLNGEGDWSLEAVLRRYAEYARSMNVGEPLEFVPRTAHQGESHWIYPVVEQVLDGAAAHDAACVQIAVDLVCSDVRFTFGKVFKDRAANILAEAELSQHQVDRLRTRAIAMLRSGFVPPEFKRYARLVRRIGLAESRDELERLVPTGPRIAWYRSYLLAPDRRPTSDA